jgi:hypothetical protein
LGSRSYGVECGKGFWLRAFGGGIGELLWGKVVLFSSCVEVVLDLLVGKGCGTWGCGKSA